MCITTSLRQGPFVWYCKANEDQCRGEPKQCWWDACCSDGSQVRRNKRESWTHDDVNPRSDVWKCSVRCRQ